MQTTQFCAFCQTSGVPGPHDHFVRASRDPKSQVTCPLLLDIKCGFCKRKGHTTKYCGDRKYAECELRMHSKVKNNTAFLAGEWMERPGLSKSTLYQQKPYLPVNTKLTSHFGALSCDSSSDSEQDPEPETTVPSGPSWSDVVKRAPFHLAFEKRPEGMSWADWNEDD